MKFLYSLCFIFSTLLTTHAFAHNVVGGVYADGFTIEGEAGFSNGSMANAGTIVKISDESGTPLGEVTTNDEGYFVFTAKKRITHVFEVNMGAGHILKMQLPAEELPDALDSSQGNKESNTTSTQVASQPTNKATQVYPVTTLDALTLEKAIAKQIKPLRREIQGLKEKSGFRDIIGGVGYIFGLLGIVALLRERRLKKAKK